MDVLRLVGLTAADVTLARLGNDLRVAIAPTGETITVQWHFYSTTANWGVERIAFADGAAWGLAEINARASGPITLTGTAGDDSLVGTGWADTLSGLAGHDTLRGGLGDDLLRGGEGSDTYVYRRADGDDRIEEGPGAPGDVDRLSLVGFRADELMFLREGADLRVALGTTGSTVTVAGQFAGASGLEEIALADGTVIPMADMAGRLVSGTDGADTLAGGAGGDFVSGGAGDDTLSGGAGDDVLDGGPGGDAIDGGAGVDTVTYAASPTVVTVDLEAGTGGGGAPLTGRYVRVYQTRPDWLSLAEVEVMSSGVNVARAGTASQTSTGWGGDAARAIDGNRDGNYSNNSVTHSGTASAYNWWQVDLGSVRAIEEIRLFNRTDGGWGVRLADIDVVVFSSAPGSDTHAAVTGQPGATTIRVPGQVGASATPFASGWAPDTLAGIENVAGSRFNDVLRGDGSANALRGHEGSDVLEGRGGDDVLSGGPGSDTFVFAGRAFGADTITDFVAGAGSDDVIEVRGGAFAGFAEVMAAARQAGADVVIEIDAANRITLQNVALAGLHADDFRIL